MLYTYQVSHNYGLGFYPIHIWPIPADTALFLRYYLEAARDVKIWCAQIQFYNLTSLLPLNTQEACPLRGGMVTNLPIIINGELVAHTKKKYRCTHAGCTKAYTKPSRLEEHERSHTGEVSCIAICVVLDLTLSSQRPFVCDACRKSYLRETHLQAHTRSHLPEFERPLACLVADCGKRFWTTQHLKVHEDMHKGTKPYPVSIWASEICAIEIWLPLQCTEDSCDEAFAKHHQLRAHICTSHAPPGTKPYRCDHGGCTRSFSTNQKLRTHSKVHDGNAFILLAAFNFTC